MTTGLHPLLSLWADALRPVRCGYMRWALREMSPQHPDSAFVEARLQELKSREVQRAGDLCQEEGGERVDFEARDVQRMEASLQAIEPFMWGVIAASTVAIVVSVALAWLK